MLAASARRVLPTDRDGTPDREASCGRVPVDVGATAVGSLVIGLSFADAAETTTAYVEVLLQITGRTHEQHACACTRTLNCSK